MLNDPGAAARSRERKTGRIGKNAKRNDPITANRARDPQKGGGAPKHDSASRTTIPLQEAQKQRRNLGDTVRLVFRRLRNRNSRHPGQREEHSEWKLLRLGVPERDSVRWRQ